MSPLDTFVANEIRAARDRAGLTLTQAAELLGSNRMVWWRYEAGERVMSEALWELWQHKAGLSKLRFKRKSLPREDR